jgi:hypothetical protein
METTEGAGEWDAEAGTTTEPIEEPRKTSETTTGTSEVTMGGVRVAEVSAKREAELVT